MNEITCSVKDIVRVFLYSVNRGRVRSWLLVPYWGYRQVERTVQCYALKMSYFDFSFSSSSSCPIHSSILKPKLSYKEFELCKITICYIISGFLHFSSDEIFFKKIYLQIPILYVITSK